jgi:hypothetical protein
MACMIAVAAQHAMGTLLLLRAAQRLLHGNM